MADDEVIDLQVPPPGRARERTDLGGRRWGGVGQVPGAWGRIVAPAALAVVLGAAAAAVGAGLVPGVPRAARTPGGLAAAAAAVACAVVAGRRAYQGGVIAVKVYEQGLVYAAGRGTHAVRWADVAAVAEQRFTVVNPLGKAIRREHCFRLVCADGTEHELEVGGIADSDVFAGYVHEGTLEHLAPWAEAELAAGRAVPFGPLTLSKTGLSDGRDLVAWNELASVDQVDGFLVICREGDAAPWFEGPCWDIPNVQLLMYLIEAKFLVGTGNHDPNQPGKSRASLLERYQKAAKKGPRIGF